MSNFEDPSKAGSESENKTPREVNKELWESLPDEMRSFGYASATGTYYPDKASALMAVNKEGEALKEARPVYMISPSVIVRMKDGRALELGLAHGRTSEESAVDHYRTQIEGIKESAAEDDRIESVEEAWTVGFLD
jgi:hypothetical protein